MRRHGFLGDIDLELLLATLVTKVAVLAIGFVALWVVSGSMPGPLEPWDRWDAPHYTDIAVYGYMAHDPGNLVHPGYQQVYPGDLDLYIVFFPLFPWLIAAVNAIVDAPVVAAFIVATAASFFVAPMLYRLVAADLGQRIGRLSALFLLVACGNVASLMLARPERRAIPVSDVEPGSRILKTATSTRRCSSDLPSSVVRLTPQLR